MNNREFCEKAIALVRNYTRDQLILYSVDPVVSDDDLQEFDVYIVWNAYILGNIKAVLATSLNDHRYYEVTYNKEKNEIYFDAYKKVENRKVEL